MWENLKSLIVWAILSIAAYLQPIQGEIEGLIFLFAINFVFGYLADMFANGSGFSFKKAWHCICEATIFFILVCAIYFIGEHKGDTKEAMQCISFVTYAVIYFYSVNIVRNIKNLVKEGSAGHKVACFLYYILTIEFIKNIPILQRFFVKDNTLKDNE